MYRVLSDVSVPFATCPMVSRVHVYEHNNGEDNIIVMEQGLLS